MRVATEALHRAFVKSLGSIVTAHSDLAKKPLLVDLSSPLHLRARLYCYTLTHPPGGRTTGEHKVQLMVPGQAKGTRANFDLSDGRVVLLAGYQPELEVFALWDSGLYRDFPHSRNVQVKAETLYAAYAGGIATQERKIWSQWDDGASGWKGIEVVVTALASRLPEAIEIRQQLSLERMLEK